jgi:hypothetical protein
MARAADDATALTALYRAKADAEVTAASAALTAGQVAPSGPADPSVLVLKGVAGPSDLAQARAMAGPDAEALAKALAALDVPSDAVLAVITRAIADVAPGAGLVADIVEAADPAWVIAVDAEAAADAAAALGIQRLAFGRPRHDAGRVWLAVDGLEASLTDAVRKKRVWAQLRTLGDVRPAAWVATSGADR